MRLKAILISILIALTACEMEPGIMADEQANLDLAYTTKSSPILKNLRATGFVQVLWKGAGKGSDMGNKPDSLLCFFDLNAHEAWNGEPPKGEISYRVLNPDSTLHREIGALVYGVHVDVNNHKAWVLASVTYDSKGCSGNGNGGHDTSCDSDAGGGCSHDDTSHDSGCTHDDSGTDGGCSHDDTGTDGGCSHDDTGTDDHGGSGSGTPGGNDTGHPLKGKHCRIGQILALKVNDGGTPGKTLDCITWKWFDPESPIAPDISAIELWPHLCKKTIIEGNIVVHD